MASAKSANKPEVASNCAICLEPYRNPRRLICQHIFCEECLSKWLHHDKERKAQNITCPYCKKVTAVPPEGVEGMPIGNTTVDGKEDYSNKLCTKCKKPDNKATVYCKGCKYYLCQCCYTLHEEWWKGSKQHEVYTIDDLQAGTTSLSDISDRYCAEHDGEEMTYYCETCRKLVCRDCVILKQCRREHDVVPLQQAVDKQMIFLNDAIAKCKVKGVECKKAIECTVTAEKALASCVDEAIDEIETKEVSYLKLVERIFDNYKKDVRKIKQERYEKLSEVRKSLSAKLSEIQSAQEVGERLAESESAIQVMKESKLVLASLQKVNNVELEKAADKTLTFGPAPVFSWTLEPEWKQTGQFPVPSCSHGSTGIAVKTDGQLAVCDYNNKILVLSEYSQLKHVIGGFKGDGDQDSEEQQVAHVTPYRYISGCRDGPQLGGSGDIGITLNAGYVTPKRSGWCNVFDRSASLSSKFKTYNSNYKESVGISVAVDKTGRILLGMNDYAISIHEATGSLIRSFSIPFWPTGITTASNDEIIATGHDSGSMQAFNYSGKRLVTFDPPPGVIKWQPQSVCCSKSDDVFVSNQGEPKAIYKYTTHGVCLGFVTTEVDHPWGVALSDDDHDLYVTEYQEKVVKIFTTPELVS